MFEAGSDSAESKEKVAVVRQAKRTSQRLLAQMASCLVGISGRVMNRAVRGRELVVIDD